MQFISRPFVVGERIEVMAPGSGSKWLVGVVERVDPMRTIIRSDACLPITIPNKVTARCPTSGVTCAKACARQVLLSTNPHKAALSGAIIPGLMCTTIRSVACWSTTSSYQVQQCSSVRHVHTADWQGTLQRLLCITSLPR